MSENISMTRISDLPEGPYTGSSGNRGMSGSEGLSNTYIPIDTHPNPYGIPAPPPGGMLPPEQTKTFKEMESPMYAPNDFSNMVQKLPQRDIPMNISQHIQDDHIQPNYIPPPPKITRDYIQEYQESSDRKIREYEERRMREKVRSHWLDELQIPILVGLLYFVFQLPIINTLIFKRFSFLSIYKDDGNFNITGLTLKCILFATSYYSMHKAVEIFGNM
jgi:hypothetical protein